MKKAQKIISMLTTVLMLTALLAGCGSKNTVAASGKSFDLTVSLASEPQTIDPALNSSLDSGTMLQHFFEGLMKWTDDGTGKAKLVFGQAESMNKILNSDGTATYTFKIRSDAKWSDGKPVTAGDFVYSWQRLVDHKTAAPYGYQLDMVKGYDEIANGTATGQTTKDKDGNIIPVMKYADDSTLGVSAPDDKTFVVTLSYDCPYFKEICAFPATVPVRMDIIEGSGDQWTFKPETYISNGPYKLSAWVHNSYIKADINKNYYDQAKLGPKSITFQLIDDANAMYSAFKSGSIQFIEEVPSDEVSTLLANGELKLNAYLATSFVCFQNQKAPFDNSLVREAFSLAIDRNYIVDKITKTGEVPANAYVPSGVYDVGGSTGDDFRKVGNKYYSVSASDYSKNCDKARELLAKAGYPGGKGFPATEYLYSTDDRNKAVAEALQQMWKSQLGVDITITNQDWSVFGSNLNSGNYSISCAAFTADYNDPCSFLDMWSTGNGNNIIRFSNTDYDVAISDAKTTSDISKRMKDFHAAEDILMGQNGIAPLYFNTSMYMLSSSVKGLYYNPLGYYFFGYCTMASK